MLHKIYSQNFEKRKRKQSRRPPNQLEAVLMVDQQLARSKTNIVKKKTFLLIKHAIFMVLSWREV